MNTLNHIDAKQAKSALSKAMIIAKSALSKAMIIATSGIISQNQRVFIISENLANANSKNVKQGEDPYRRKIVKFRTFFDNNVGANIVQADAITFDKTPFTSIYDPNDPACDKNGKVYMANVKPMIEMADMREAVRSHESCIKSLEKIMSMMHNTIKILNG